MSTDLKKMYKTIMDDHFPPQMEISFVDKNQRQTLFYEKVDWTIDNIRKGLRYGENPGQEAALYKLVNGNLILGDTETIQPGQYLVSDIELLQSGKHPGKTNLTDADNALNILRYFSDQPAVIIVKHNNPCGAAISDSLEDAYHKAYMADRVAAFGGCIAVNRPIDKATAESIAKRAVEAMDGVGLFGVEMFLTENGDILINEIAPRTHNSGHHTIEACVTDQFEQHLRAVMGLPLGSVEQLSPAVMLNLLGAPGSEGTVKLSGLAEALMIHNVSVHLYGKAQSRPYRKMGHATILNQNLETAEQIAEKLREIITIAGENEL
jgi:hypothetical protein